MSVSVTSTGVTSGIGDEIPRLVREATPAPAPAPPAPKPEPAEAPEMSWAADIFTGSFGVWALGANRSIGREVLARR